MHSRNLGFSSGGVAMSGAGGQAEEPYEEEHMVPDPLKAMEKHLHIFRKGWAARGELSLEMQIQGYALGQW